MTVPQAAKQTDEDADSSQPRRELDGLLLSRLGDLLRSVENEPGEMVEVATAEFVEGMVAVETRLRELVAESPRSNRRRRREDTMADLIDQAPLAHGEKDLLHDLRRVRNALAHNADVHVGKAYAHAALRRLRQIAARLEARELNAARLMTRDVRSVAPDTPLSEVQSILLRRGISQVALVDARGQLHGWVTHRSLLRELSGGPPSADRGARPANTALADRGVVPVDPGATMEEMVRHLEDPDIQTLAVMQQGRLAGLVTRADLLRVVL